MPKLVVLYPLPTDVIAFEKQFREEHAPLVHAQLAGVRRLEASRVMTPPRDEGQFHWIAELYFDSVEALRAAAGSVGAERLAGHARQISTGGEPTMLLVDDPISA